MRNVMEGWTGEKEPREVRVDDDGKLVLSGEAPSGEEQVTTVGSGEAENFDVRGAAFLTIITDDAATATVSRVDSMDETSHSDDAGEFEVGTDQIVSVDADSPYFRVSSASGATRVLIN